MNEIEGLILKKGPALIAMNFCPHSSKETISESPEGVLWIVVTSVIFEFGNMEA
jgi:hypothetical protein